MASIGPATVYFSSGMAYWAQDVCVNVSDYAAPNVWAKATAYAMRILALQRNAWTMDRLAAARYHERRALHRHLSPAQYAQAMKFNGFVAVGSKTGNRYWISLCRPCENVFELMGNTYYPKRRHCANSRHKGRIVHNCIVQKYTIENAEQQFLDSSIWAPADYFTYRGVIKAPEFTRQILYGPWGYGSNFYAI